MRARSLLFTVWGDTIRPAGGEIGVGSLIRLMAPLELTPRAVRAAVLRMARQGWLRTRRIGRRAYYRLTPPGEWRVEQGVRRVYHPHPDRWDGRWRLLTYVISEGRRPDRDRLRRELAWLGLGPLSRSTWLTPRDLGAVLIELVSSRGLQGDVTMFDARHLGPGGDETLVRRCWDLETIAARYRRFIAATRARTEILRRGLRDGRLSDAACFAERILLVHEYRKFLFVDPGLPDDLLPPGWPGREAAHLFRSTYQVLARRASRFVAASFEPPPGRKEAFRITDPFAAARGAAGAPPAASPADHAGRDAQPKRPAFPVRMARGLTAAE